MCVMVPWKTYLLIVDYLLEQNRNDLVDMFVIVSHWKLENDSFLWDIAVPVNSTATVYVPAKEVKTLSEGGKPLHDAAGVTFLRMEADRAVLRVASGTYRFQSQYDRGKN